MTIALMAALAVPAQAQTLLQRFDVRGTGTYHVSAVFLKGGWEGWALGDNHRKTLDLQVGKSVLSGKRLSLTGYAAVWPASGKIFAIPWLNYHDQVARGQLSLNLATYVPLNGGPRILFSDSSSLMWGKSVRAGLAGKYWNQSGFSPSASVGPQVEVSRGPTTLRVAWYGVPILGQPKAMIRFEIVQGL